MLEAPASSHKQPEAAHKRAAGKRPVVSKQLAVGSRHRRLAARSRHKRQARRKRRADERMPRAGKAQAKPL